MAQKIKQGNIFGRIGSAMGQGLAESIPKEANRMRLSQGLMDLSKEKDLEPLQFMSKFYGIPEVANNPQLVQSGTQLYNQSRRNQAIGQYEDLEKQKQDEKNQSILNQIENQAQNTGEKSKNPSVVDPELIQRNLKGFIPTADINEIKREGAKRYKGHEAEYGHDITNAINEYKEEQQLKSQQAAAVHNVLGTQREEEKTIKKFLEDKLTQNNASFPEDFRQTLEDEAIDRFKNGGESEQSIIADMSKKIKKANERYSNLNAIPNWGLPFYTPQGARKVIDNIKALQPQFEAEDTTKNFAQLLVGDKGLSWGKSYSFAEPLDREPKLNSVVQKLKSLPNNAAPMLGNLPSNSFSGEKRKLETRRAMNEIIPVMTSKSSPLAIMHELEQKNYDMEMVLDRFKKIKNKLTPDQQEQLDKTDAPYSRLNDIILNIWGK